MQIDGKDDKGKPNWALLPAEEVQDVVKVLTFGAEKYSAEGWKSVQNLQDRYFAATMRHLVAHRTGEEIDSETNLPHLSHAICCLLFMAHGGDEKQNEANQ